MGLVPHILFLTIPTNMVPPVVLFQASETRYPLLIFTHMRCLPESATITSGCFIWRCSRAAISRVARRLSRHCRPTGSCNPHPSDGMGSRRPPLSSYLGSNNLSIPRRVLRLQLGFRCPNPPMRAAGRALRLPINAFHPRHFSANTINYGQFNFIF